MRIEPFVKVVLLGLLALTFVPALAGAGPIISVSPASHDFGRVNVGTTSASFDFTVSNIGDATLIVTLPLTHSSPGFSASIASTNIPPGASTLLHTSYTPSGSGPQSDNVTISSNASNGNANVLLRGTANNAPVCNPPLSSNYFACASVAFSLTAKGLDARGAMGVIVLEGVAITVLVVVGLREGTNSLDSVWAKEQTTAASIQYRV